MAAQKWNGLSRCRPVQSTLIRHRNALLGRLLNGKTGCGATTVPAIPEGRSRHETGCQILPLANLRAWTSSNKENPSARLLRAH